MLDAERVRLILSQAFPDLAITDLRYLAAGWDFEVWEVRTEASAGPSPAGGGERAPLLFRFPFREDCVVQVRRETRLLQALGPHLPVDVPQPFYESEGCEAFGLPFFGYAKIEGVPLSSAQLSDRQREAVGQELGRFLTALHSFDAGRAAALGVKRYDAASWREHQRAFQEKCRAAVLPLLPEDERAAVETFWREFIERDEHFRFDAVLIHYDLGMEHVLVDEARGQMTGVIDFADAAIGDPALDFVGMSDDLRRAAASTYALPVGDAFDARVTYFWKIGPLHDVIFGLGDGGQEHVDAGLRGIRERVLGAQAVQRTS